MATQFMAWTPKMSVGVKALDDDHKELVSILNALHNGIVSRLGTVTLGNVLDDLASYVKIHFAREEEYFAQTEYPAKAAHILEHQNMAAKIMVIRARYNKGQFESLSLETMEFLKDWLYEHILGSDQMYKDHFKANGIH